MSARPEAPGLRTFLVTIAALLQQWRVVIGIPIVCVVVAIALALVIRPVYRSIATFIVDSETLSLQSAGGLAGLASQFGFRLPSGGQSPQFFADLVTSREVLLTVASSKYPVSRAGGDSLVALPPLYRLDPTNTPKGMEAILKRLRRDIRTTADVETGMVTVTVDAPDPVLATAIADTLLQAVNRFNLERRQSRSRALRQFLETRLIGAGAELRSAEDSLRGFRERNRTTTQSPELALQDQRLQRSVELRQQLYVTLSTSYEQARIEEFRDTPSITIVDPPRPPYRRAWPKRALLVGGAAFLGLLLGLAIALLRQSVSALDQDELTAWAAARNAAEGIPIVRALRRGRSGSTPSS